MTLRGRWYESGRAVSYDALLNFDEDTYSLVVDDCEISRGDPRTLLISERLGQIERKLELPDGSVFATQDQARVEELLLLTQRSSSWVARLEASWKWALIALVLTVLTTFSFFRWGLPWVAHEVANALPQGVGERVGEEALQFLDRFIFEPSQLTEARQDEIRDEFLNRLVPAHRVDGSISYALHFRALGEDDDRVANAMALPSGDIILTDLFVELASTQDEIDAVLLHEMGHVEHRHSMEMLTQSTLVAVLLTFVTGDASGAGDMGIGLGSLLVTTGFSRRSEKEADQFAFTHMLKAGVNPSAFVTILNRISRDPADDEASESGLSDVGSHWRDYFSTHPNNRARSEAANHYSRCFDEGLIDCPASVMTTP